MNEKELMEQSQKQVFTKDMKKQATIDLNSNQLYTEEQKKYEIQKKKMELRENKQIRKNETPYNPNSCCAGDPCGGGGGGDCFCDAECCDLIILILCCPIMIFD